MKRKVMSLVSVIAIVLCFFFMPNVKAETLQEQKQANQEKQEIMNNNCLNMIYFYKYCFE